jgi:type VI secretion system protein ImpG
MDDELHRYYERELTYIFRHAQEFARQYPATAGRLLLEETRSNDPHVERLIESFALLTGRIRRKLDDEFPQLTDAFLGVLYPHYLLPIPSMGIVQFELDPVRGELPEGFTLPRGSELLTQPVDGVRCAFRTAYPVQLWPIEVADAKFLTPPFPPSFRPPPGTVSAIRIQLRTTTELPLSELTIDSLRFYLSGEKPLVAGLYDTIFGMTRRVDLFTDPNTLARSLEPGEAIGEVGFAADEGLLPYPGQSFRGYRLLTELFAFPDKFHFLDLNGLRPALAGAGATLEIVLYLGRASKTLAQGVGPETFRLGCSPIINLFEKVVEPIPERFMRNEYRIVPDVAAPQGLEIYTIDSVQGVDPPRTTEYHPFYSFRHGEGRSVRRAFWHARRRPSNVENDRGTEVSISLVDLDFDPRATDEPTMVVRATCTNRDLPRKLKHASFTTVAPAPFSAVHALRQPTAALRPPLGQGTRWRLISHLCLNHLSLTDDAQGLEAVHELLRLYDFSDPELDQAAASGARRLIEGLVGMHSRRVVDWNGGPEDGGFCRGVEITITLDEAKYVGTGAILFASVLERFFGLYTTTNSFTRLIVRVRTPQGETELKRWPPRAGENPTI